MKTLLVVMILVGCVVGQEKKECFERPAGDGCNTETVCGKSVSVTAMYCDHKSIFDDAKPATKKQAQKCEPKDRDSCCWVGVTEGCNGGACNPEQAGLHWDTKTCKWEMPKGWKAVKKLPKDGKCFHQDGTWGSCLPQPRCQNGIIWEGHEICMTKGPYEVQVKSERDCGPRSATFVNSETNGVTCQYEEKRISVDGKVVWKRVSLI